MKRNSIINDYLINNEIPLKTKLLVSTTLNYLKLMNDFNVKLNNEQYDKLMKRAKLDSERIEKEIKDSL